MLKQHEVDLSYTSQTTVCDVGLEIRSEQELAALIALLQDDDCDWLVLHNRRRNITFHIYLRFREGKQS